MRFMMIVRATKDSEAGVLPSKELVAEMGRFNEEMMKAGVLLAAEGLHPVKGRACQVLQRQPHLDRRTLCGDKGADCRLLDNSGEVSARGD